MPKNLRLRFHTKTHVTQTQRKHIRAALMQNLVSETTPANTAIVGRFIYYLRLDGRCLFVESHKKERDDLGRSVVRKSRFHVSILP